VYVGVLVLVVVLVVIGVFFKKIVLNGVGKYNS
jgi:hypothetical protein